MEPFLMSAGGYLGLYCALFVLASLAGGWVLLAMRLTHSRLQGVVSFVAGLMLGMALLHFIPHAAFASGSLDRTVELTLGGFIVMFFLQRFLPHHHHDVPEGAPEQAESAAEEPHAHHHDHDHDHEHGHEHEHEHAGHCHGHAADETLASRSAGRLSWVATTVGMALHSIMDGVALGAAVAVAAGGHSGLVGLGAALVIILHKPFDAMAVSTLMAVGGCSRSTRHVMNALFALITPVSAALFYLGASHWFGASPAFLGGALAFCAGTFLCIACADLLPELQFHSHDRLKLSIALAAGLGVSVLIGQFETSGHERHQHQEPAPEHVHESK